MEACQWLVFGTAFVAVAQPHNAAHGTGRSDDVATAVWRPANDVQISDTPYPDSNVGSSGVAETRNRIPCEGRRGDASGAHGWPTSGACGYVDLVPWEVVLPWGPPERFLISLSGTFID